MTRSGNALVYTAAAGFFGADTFDYVISDGSANDTGRVTVTVNATTPPPAGNMVQLGPAQRPTPARRAPADHVVDAATDSTQALLDRITSFSVPAATGSTSRRWAGTAGTSSSTRSATGSPTSSPASTGRTASRCGSTEGGQLAGAFMFDDGPDGFARSLDDSVTVPDAVFVHAGDTLV